MSYCNDCGDFRVYDDCCDRTLQNVDLVITQETIIDPSGAAAELFIGCPFLSLINYNGKLGKESSFNSQKVGFYIVDQTISEPTESDKLNLPNAEIKIQGIFPDGNTTILLSDPNKSVVDVYCDLSGDILTLENLKPFRETRRV